MRHYFKTIFFVLGLLLIPFGCEKELIDDMQPIQQQSKSKIRLNTGSDVSIRATNFLKQKTSNALNVSFVKGRLTLSSNDFMSRETSMGTIDTSKEIVVENEYNTKHTFALQNTQSSNILVNVIVVETQDVIYEYFKVYHFEGKIPYDKYKTIDLSQFTGRIETYNSNDNITGLTVLNNGITTGAGGDSTPCPDDDDVWDGWDDFWENFNDNDGSSGGGTNNDGSANNNDSDDSNSNDGGTSTSSGGGDAEIENVDGCDIYYVDSDGDRWETDEWSPSDGTESCCMYLIVNCGSGNYSSTMARNAEDEDPCADGPVAVLVNVEALKDDIEECLGTEYDSAWFDDNSNYYNTIDIHAYLNENCTNESKNFVDPAKDALDEGGEVDFDMEIIYTINKPCQKEIVKNIMNLTSDLTDIINDTFDTSDKANVKFWNGDIATGDPAQTSTSYEGDPENFIIKIKFDNA
ncbi:hypothetical protein [Psychroserpens burtonensis]|uniref:hypothetical protein n=1 Tax=Psychroserpens burtonensis TaxID=49278 RepID=UPI000409D2C5|nr:hypothetical protein [Psychroserpens burtonensis]